MSYSFQIAFVIEFIKYPNIHKSWRLVLVVVIELLLLKKKKKNISLKTKRNKQFDKICYIYKPQLLQYNRVSTSLRTIGCSSLMVRYYQVRCLTFEIKNKKRFKVMLILFIQKKVDTIWTLFLNKLLDKNLKFNIQGKF